MSKFVLTAQLQLQAPNNVSQIVSQIQNQLNNVSVNVQVKGSAQANQQLQQITQSTQAATTAAGRMGNAFAVSIRRFAAFSIATRAVGLFTSTLADAVKTAIDFERELIKISQVTGRSVSSLRDLTDSVTNLSTGLGVTSQSLLEVTTVLTQAGLSSEDTKIALESLAKAALAPNFDSISETAEGAIAILAQFKQGVGALEGQLSSIDAVAGAFAVEAGDLIDVIRRSGGVFKASGGSLNELLALFTSVRATTRESAESIGTGLRTIFTRIQRPETIEFLKQFGVELVDLNGKFVGPYEAIKRLSEAISGLGEGDLTFIKIAEELGGFRQIGKVLPLLQQFSTAQAALNVAQNAGNGLTKNAETAQASLAIRIIKVREEFLALVRSMTETTTFQVMANTALALASALIKIADSIKPLLPLLGAVAAFKAVKGIGGFLGGVGAGLTSGKTFHAGGRVHAFATGGLVPGTGNSDTVPAMLTPGEFVIRKSSVQKLGASNLAHMNTGGIVQKFAAGGRVFGAVGLTPMNDVEDETGRVIIGTGSPKEVSISSVLARKAGGGGSTGIFSKDSRFKKKDWEQAIRSAIGGPSVPTKVVGRTFKLADLENNLGQQVDGAISSLVTSTAQTLGAKTGVSIEGSVTPNILSSIGTRSTIGSIFEGALSLLGAPFDKSISNEQDPFDFPSGLGSGLTQYFGFQQGIPVEAKKYLSDDLMKDIANRKATNLIAEEVYKSPQWQSLLRPTKKHFGGIIQKFAMGGRAKGIEGAPLVDDILQASGSILPRPSKAIQDLIKAGGGAVDIDRTLKRTVGDTAYAKAPTPGAKDAALNTYFRDEQKRLSDLKIAPITQFGTELQAAIKNGQLNARKISIISKSKRVKGAAEYLSSLFGIPTQNMIFTQGGSKQPAIDAIRTKGSRVDRVAKFAMGGQARKVDFEAGVGPSPFASQKSNKLGQEAYALQKSSGLSNLEFDEIKRTADTYGYNITEFKQYLAKRVEEKKRKLGSKTDPSSLARSLMPSTPQATPKQLALANQLGARKMFATGGNVGTDTVPALLTPGEFVVNKASAQRIGYGNLHRMNTVGKYAKGGIVQHFAQGSGPSGVQAPTMVGTGGTGPGQNFVPLTMLTKQAQTLAQAQQAQTQTTQQATQTTQSNTDAVEQNGLSFMAATIGLGAIQSAFAALTPVIDKNSTAFEKVTASVLNSVSSLVNTLGIAIIALQQLNIQITASTAKMVAQNAFDFLSGAKSLTEVFKTAKDGIPGLKNFTNSFKIASGKGGGNFVMAPSRAGEMAGNAVNKLTGGTGTFAGARSNLFPTFDKGIKNSQALGGTVSESFKYGRSVSDLALKDVGSAAQVSEEVFKGAGKARGFTANVSARSGALFQRGADVAQRVGGVATRAAAPVMNIASRAGGAIGKVAASAAAPIGNMLAPIIGPLTSKLAPAVTQAASLFGSLKPSLSNFNKLSGPALGLGLVFQAVSSAADAYLDYQGQANKAIQDGNAIKAASMAKEAAGAEAVNSLGSSIIGVSALFGPVGLGLGTLAAGLLKAASESKTFGPFIKSAAIQIGTLFGGKTEDSIMSLAAAQAQGVATQKALTQSGEAATKAMTDFQNGAISAAEALAATAGGGAAVMKEAEVNKKAIADNEKNKAGGISGVGRDVLALGGFNPFLETSAARNAKIDQENKGLSEQSKKSQETLIQQSTPAINALSGDIAAAGGTFNDVMDQIKATNPGLYFSLLNQGSGELKKSFDNIKKEVERAQKAFNAMNLGMQNVQGAAAAAALGVNNYVASQQAGNIGLEQSLAVLEASVTSAAQGISDADFGKALSDADATLANFGASKEQREKFSGNISAVNEVQKNQSTIFADTKDQLAADIRKSNSADQRKKIFSDTVTKRLESEKNADGTNKYSPETIQRFKDASANMSDDQLKKIGEGDFTAFEESINELGKKTMEQVSGPLKAAIEIQKQLNDLTKQRIEAERQLVSAQLEASNVRMEAMDIAAKYGGPKVTPEMRAQNIVQQANIQSQGIKGVTNLKTGSAQELSQRTQQLSTRQAEISAIRMRAAQGDAGAQKQLQGDSGLKLQEEEKKLQDAAKSQVQATRDLIKSKEEELRLIKEKNQLEKSSIDALVSGDIEKFFDQQAAVGAQAAIATGDQRLIGQFGMSALGGAAQETRRQQEAGVQELYGQKLSGPGGLTERAYGSAISAAGVQNPLAMAQVAAGSTGAEAAVESDIRDLAATMGPAADIQTQAAQDQVIAAQMQLDAARARGEEAVSQMQARQMATGGVVYANRGIFVPRGTDTVPAMLTPGEFVVNRAAVQRGNNLQILQSMNRGVSTSAPAASSQSSGVAAMANGGIVRYREAGSTGPESGGAGISAEALNAFATALSQFNTELTKNIKTLSDTKFQITLNPTNINVNLTGTSFLSNLTASIKQDLLKFLGEEISNYSVGNDGKLRKSGSTLGTIT